MIKRVQGTVHGRVIEFEEDLGFRDGEKVDVTVDKSKLNVAAWGDGLRRCAGVLADSWTEDDDRILQQIYLERQADTRPDV